MHPQAYQQDAGQINVRLCMATSLMSWGCLNQTCLMHTSSCFLPFVSCVSLKICRIFEFATVSCPHFMYCCLLLFLLHLWASGWLLRCEPDKDNPVQSLTATSLIFLACWRFSPRILNCPHLSLAASWTLIYFSHSSAHVHLQVGHISTFFSMAESYYIKLPKLRGILPDSLDRDSGSWLIVNFTIYC